MPTVYWVPWLAEIRRGAPGMQGTIGSAQLELPNGHKYGSYNRVMRVWAIQL